MAVDTLNKVQTKNLEELNANLTAHDRCDQCNVARATNLVRKDNHILTMCKHHYEKNLPALITQGWEV